MNPQRERAREHYPAVLLGVLGIIQALALELLWENGVGGIDRWRALDATASGWLQVTSIFLGLVVTWLMYATIVLRFAWVPSFLDLVFPFVIGGLEFLLVELTEPGRAAGFFALLAGIFVVSSAGTFAIYAALVREGAIPRLPLATQLRGYVPAAGATVGLLFCSAVAAVTGPSSGATRLCLVLANASLLMQIAVFWHYWRRDLARQA